MAIPLIPFFFTILKHFKGKKLNCGWDV